MMNDDNMEDIGLVAIVCGACLIRWPISTSTMLMSVPINAGIAIHDKLRSIQRHRLLRGNRKADIQ